MDINKKAYTGHRVHFGPHGKDLCERGKRTHLENLTKLNILVKATDYRPNPVQEQAQLQYNRQYDMTNL
jgi:hypothetical protein